jgi:hypothetical protein
MDPQLRTAMLQNPALAMQYMQGIAKPPEFKTAGPYFGTFQNGEFTIQGALPPFKTLEPQEKAAYYSPPLPDAHPDTGGPAVIFPQFLPSRGKDSAATDLDLARGAAKIFDPNAVVREGEVKLVGKAQSIPEDVQVLMRRVAFGEGRLTPQARARILEVVRTHLGELKRAQ